MAISLSLIACGGKPAEVPVSGGTTDNTNYGAKKEIASKNVVEFSTSFFIFDKYEAGNDGMFRASIKDNDKGEHVLTVSGVYDHELVVGDEVLAGVQDIIDKYNLVKKNGDGKVTAGLPPEYGPWELDVLYDSGEELYFYENGEPDGDWTGAFRDYFIKVMADAGCEDVLPPKEALTIVQVSTTFEKDGQSHHYGEIEVPTDGGDKVFFWHRVWDIDQEKTVQKDYAKITDELYEGLQNVIEENNMDILHAPETVSFDLKASPDGFLEFYVDYENGRQIYCEYTAEELPEGWAAMKDALVEYLDNYIDEHKVNMGDE